MKDLHNLVDFNLETFKANADSIFAPETHFKFEALVGLMGSIEL